MTDGVISVDTFVAFLLIVSGITSSAAYIVGKGHGRDEVLRRLDRRRR